MKLSWRTVLGLLHTFGGLLIFQAVGETLPDSRQGAGARFLRNRHLSTPNQSYSYLRAKRFTF